MEPVPQSHVWRSTPHKGRIHKDTAAQSTGSRANSVLLACVIRKLETTEWDLPQAESYWKLTVCLSRLDTSLPTAYKMYLVFLMPWHCDLPGSMLLIKTKRITESIGCSWTVCSFFAVGYLPQVESRILSIFLWNKIWTESEENNFSAWIAGTKNCFLRTPPSWKYWNLCLTWLRCCSDWKV